MPDSSKLLVVHVAGQLDVGGMEKLLIEFARHADRDRFNLHFISLGKRGTVADEIEKLGWCVTSMKTPDGLHPGLIVRLARQFHSLRADVIHTHNTRPLLYAGPAATLARIPRVVHTRHGQRFGASRRETVLFRLAALTVDHFVCVSHDSARITRREGISAKRIRTVWNGIDLSRFSSATPEGSGPIVAIGRLSPEKDFATLVRAAAVAASRDPSFRLDIAGDGSCMSEITQLVGQLKLEAVVRLLGQVGDIPSLLGHASAFVLPSLTEGVSLTILEAMAAGLPVVATRVGGNPEVVVDGETGLLVPPSDPEALADALLKVWRHPEQRRAMGDAGRARVRKHFDVRRMVAEYERLYVEGNRSIDRVKSEGIAGPSINTAS